MEKVRDRESRWKIQQNKRGRNQIEKKNFTIVNSTKQIARDQRETRDILSEKKEGKRGVKKRKRKKDIKYNEKDTFLHLFNGGKGERVMAI